MQSLWGSWCDARTRSFCPAAHHPPHPVPGGFSPRESAVKEPRTLVLQACHQVPPTRTAICCKKTVTGGAGASSSPPPPQAATSALPPAAPAAGLGAHPADCLLKTLRCVDPSGSPSRVCWPHGCTHPVCPLRAEPQHNSSDCVIFVSKVGGVFSHSEPRVCDRRLPRPLPTPSALSLGTSGSGSLSPHF